MAGKNLVVIKKECDVKFNFLTNRMEGKSQSSQFEKLHNQSQITRNSRWIQGCRESVKTGGCVRGSGVAKPLYCKIFMVKPISYTR